MRAARRLCYIVGMTTARARQLRLAQTEVEKRLWYRTRSRQIEACKFRRQAVIGRYIVDFVCLEARIIVELDGGQHDAQRNYDAARDRWLTEQGFQVIRIWNNAVTQNVAGVAEAILRAVRHPHPVLPPSRGKGPPDPRP